MRIRKIVVRNSGYLSVAAILIVLPTAAYAWNIICGISMFSVQAPPQLLTDKWDADSRALRAIAFYYMGVSELQRIDLKPDGTFSAPQSFTSQNTVVRSAMEDFRQSSDEFDSALKLAAKDHLGDKNGLELLNHMKSQSAKFFADMNVSDHLPDLNQLQDMARSIGEYTLHGIELSQQHLRDGMPGHGVGGAKYKIK